jgi:hypothetical protein
MSVMKKQYDPMEVFEGSGGTMNCNQIGFDYNVGQYPNISSPLAYYNFIDGFKLLCCIVNCEENTVKYMINCNDNRIFFGDLQNAVKAYDEIQDVPEKESDRIERELEERLGRKPSLAELNTELRKGLDAIIATKKFT